MIDSLDPPDFQVTSPTKGVQWANNETYPISWVKGVLDGVDFIDLELTRMGTDGLILIARDGAPRAPSRAPSSVLTSQIFFSLLQYPQQAVASTSH